LDGIIEFFKLFEDIQPDNKYQSTFLNLQLQKPDHESPLELDKKKRSFSPLRCPELWMAPRIKFVSPSHYLFLEDGAL